MGSCSGVFFVLDRRLGRRRASHDTSREDGIPREFHGDPLLAGDLVVIGTDASEGDSAYIHAFERGTARERWRRASKGGVRGDLARWRDHGYAVTLEDELICFDPASGNARWSFRANSLVTGAPPRSPLVLGDRVLYADRDGVVRAFEPASGRLLWTRPQIEGVSTDLAGAGGGVWFVRGERTLVMLDPQDGREVSRTPIAGGPYARPVVAAGDSVLLLLGSATLTSFDVARREVRWSRTGSRPWSSARPYVWQGAALAGTEGGSLHAFELADGSQRWVHTLPGVIRGIGMQADTLYVGTLSGRLHALVPRGDHEPGTR